MSIVVWGDGDPHDAVIRFERRRRVEASRTPRGETQHGGGDVGLCRQRFAASTISHAESSATPGRRRFHRRRASAFSVSDFCSRFRDHEVAEGNVDGWRPLRSVPRVMICVWHSRCGRQILEGVLLHAVEINLDRVGSVSERSPAGVRGACLCLWLFPFFDFLAQFV